MDCFVRLLLPAQNKNASLLDHVAEEKKNSEIPNRNTIQLERIWRADIIK